MAFDIVQFVRYFEGLKYYQDDLRTG